MRPPLVTIWWLSGGSLGNDDDDDDDDDDDRGRGGGERALVRREGRRLAGATKHGPAQSTRRPAAATDETHRVAKETLLN
jgi:hypothetical protein